MPEPCVTDQKPDFPMSRTEFVALIAMMFATIAFSIDAMLPALPEIAKEPVSYTHLTLPTNREV